MILTTTHLIRHGCKSLVSDFFNIVPRVSGFELTDTCIKRYTKKSWQRYERTLSCIISKVGAVVRILHKKKIDDGEKSMLLWLSVHLLIRDVIWYD